MHLQLVYRVLHHLKRLSEKWIIFRKSNKLILKVYTDAYHGESVADKRSTKRYCTFLWNDLITSRSKKYYVIERLSKKSKFRVRAQGVYELLWIKIILEDFRIKWENPVRLHCDKKLIINITHNLLQYDPT